MSVLNENTLLGASGAGSYEIEQSLRFDAPNNSYLSRTFPSAGNLKTWTWSAWVKRGTFAGNQMLFSPTQNSNGIYFTADGILTVEYNSPNYYKQTSAKYRDPSAWYHVVVVWNTPSSTAEDRIQIWVNGERVTAFSGSSIPNQNRDSYINTAVEHNIGDRASDQDMGFDGYMGEVNFIDGQALTPDSFGETGKYGEWKPIEYAGTYGTNGFYLPFEQDYSVEGFSTVVWENDLPKYVGGVGFQSDLLWAKSRLNVQNHVITDAVTGFNGYGSTSRTNAFYSNLTSIAPTADGFTSNTDFFTNGQTYVAWNWDMGSATASNTDGTITTSVRANTTYGQSIVSWTGNATNNTRLGHGLGSTPEIVIVKSRTTAAPWKVGGSVIQAVFGDGSNNSAFLSLNTNAGADQHTTGFQGNTATTIGVGADSDTNSNGATYIAYAFHSVTGYSKCGSYSGNGSTTGPTVALGFSPAFVIIKSMGVEHWKMYDNVRNPFNPVNTIVNANEADAEATSGNNTLNFTATGFQCTSTSGATNASGGKYIYMAFADTREYAYWLDQSGNNNDWESEGGLTESDVMVDSPTNNFCTFNPLDSFGTPVLSEGNLKFQLNTARCRGTIASQADGKIYFELYNPTLVSNTNVHHMGLASIGLNINNASNMENAAGGGAVVWTYANANGRSIYARQNGSNIATVALPNAIAAGDIIAFASDSSTGKVWMSQNNSWLKANGSFDGSNALSASNYLFQLATGHELTPFTMPLGSTPTTIGVLNCGQDSSFAGAKAPQGNQDSNGIGDFYYPVPSGFLALCSANLPSVDVIPSKNFNTVLYTGNGSTQSITGVGFQPDFVWWKSRSGSNSHVQNDSVRGVELMLRSNLTNAESSGDLTAFQSDGFSVRNTVDNGNYNNETYASWNWKAGGATPSKTYAVTVVSDSGNKYRLDGFGTSAVTLNLQEGGTYTFNYPSAHPFRFSTTANGTHGGGSEYTTGVTHVSSTQTKIVVAASAPALYYYCSVHSGMGGAVNTNAAFGSSNFSGSTISTVSTNVAAGFSIVTYTGTGSNATVGHGLSQKPSMSLIKPRNFADNWIVTYDAVDGSDDQAYLNLTNAGASPAAQYAVAQNATTLGLTGWNNVNDANDTYVAYCFHSVVGYSKVGSFVGNGSATAGPFVHCGFKPAFVLIKRSSAAQDWYLWDTKTSPVNPVAATLSPNSSGAEGNRSSLPTDVLSNGFKIRNTSIGWNGSGDTYIFIAFAESPFKNSNAR